MPERGWEDGRLWLVYEREVCFPERSRRFQSREENEMGCGGGKVLNPNEGTTVPEGVT